MPGERLTVAAWVWLWVAAVLSAPLYAQELRSDFSLLGQVRDGDQSRQTEAPNDLYGELGATDFKHGANADTYFRLERDFGPDSGAADFYAGYLQAAATRGVDVTLGRQFLSEGPGGVFVADAGKIRIDPGGPVAFTVFGGQPRYFEPTFSAASLSQDEQIFGGNMRTTHMKGGYLSLGYLQQQRDGRVLRQLINGNGAHAFSTLPGLPNVYGSAAFDADRQNLDQATTGFDVFLSQPRLLFNFESSYYKPQDQGKHLITDINRREDPIFELFSLSQLLQFRGGLRYTLSRTVSAYGDYSYQRYEKLTGIFENGHVGSVGVLWMPGGDGLEVVRVEYYVVYSHGGNVNGGRGHYECRVYDRIVFRTKIDVAAYETVSNTHSTAVSSLLGVGYVLAPGLVGEVNFEANRNTRFNEDFRFGFLITYHFRYRSWPSERAQEGTS